MRSRERERERDRDVEECGERENASSSKLHLYYPHHHCPHHLKMFYVLYVLMVFFSVNVLYTVIDIQNLEEIVKKAVYCDKLFSVKKTYL